jgi:hypothetical protein
MGIASLDVLLRGNRLLLLLRQHLRLRVSRHHNYTAKLTMIDPSLHIGIGLRLEGV